MSVVFGDLDTVNTDTQVKPLERGKKIYRAALDGVGSISATVQIWGRDPDGDTLIGAITLANLEQATDTFTDSEDYAGYFFRLTAISGTSANVSTSVEIVSDVSTSLTDGAGNTVDAANGLPVSLATKVAGERNPGTSNNYLASVPECNYALVTADTDVSTSNPAILLGVTVLASLSADVDIRNSTTAGSGDVVLTVPSSASVGDYFECNGIKLNTALFADFGGTGTLRIDWRY